MRLPGSIRLRITAVAAAGVAVVLAVTALVILSVQRNQLIDNLDNSLEQRSDAIRAGLEAGESGALAVSGDGDRFVQLVASDGAVIAASSNVSGLASAVGPGHGDGASTVSDFDLEDDAYRVLVTSAGSGRSLVVGENIDDVNDAMRNLRLTLWAAVPAVVGLLAILTWWLVGRTLEPVDRIRSEVAAIHAGALDRRVRRPATDDEIADLVETMNDMLDRVEQATSRQERFIADASHELKSPLARMRTEIEVDAAARGTPDPLVSSLLEEVTGLQGLVEDLLHLARVDAGVHSGRRAPVDLDDIALHEARILRDSTGHRVDTSRVSAGHVAGDRVELQRMVRNLTDNAARHASSSVSIVVEERDGHVILEVADDGVGVPEAELERIFDRFTRLDASRSARTGGTGLGLAIVRDIVERHGGAVSARPNAPRGLRFVVMLPTVPPST